MNSIRITFRLTSYQLACGLEAIRLLEPNYKLTSHNNLVKKIYQSVQKIIIGDQFIPLSSTIEEIENYFNQSKGKINLDDLIISIEKRS